MIPVESFVASARAALPGIDAAWLHDLIATAELTRQNAKPSPAEALELLASLLPESYLEVLAEGAVPSDEWARLFVSLEGERPTFEKQQETALHAIWKQTNEEYENSYEQALALRLVRSDDASKQRFIELALRYARKFTDLSRSYFDCLTLLGDDGSRVEQVLRSRAIGSAGNFDSDLIEGALGALAANPAARARVPAVLENLKKRGVPVALIARTEAVVAAAPAIMWTALFDAPPAYDWDPAATLVLHLLVTDPNLVAHLGQRTDAELDALVGFPVSPHDEGKLREAKQKLAGAIGELLQARSISWSKKGAANLAKLGVGTKKGDNPKARARLPAIPAEVDAMLDLLDEHRVRLPKPAKTEAPSALPAPLRALYARVGKSPTNESWLSSVTGLGALKRRFDETLSEAEEEDDLGENLKRTLFSATPALLPFGTSDNGGFYFLDPQRHDALVFELAHDETELRAVATSLATFVAVRMLEEWADENALDEELARLVEKDEKAAKKAAKAKRS